MGSNSTRLSELKDGFYIEVRNKNSKLGVKIRRDTKEQLLYAVREYLKNKEVTVLGEIKGGKLIGMNLQQQL